jgi:Zn/Cd-binding protein ZinT
MKRSQFSLLMLFFLTALLFAVYGCSDSDDDDDYVPSTNLSTHWQGSWNSFDSLLSSGAYDGVINSELYSYKLSHSGNAPIDFWELKEMLIEWFAIDFTAMNFDGDTLKIYNNSLTSDSPADTPAKTVSYKFVETREVMGETMFVFESERNDGFKYLAAFPGGVDEGETLSHFHFRYGDENTGIDKLVDFLDPDWALSWAAPETGMTWTPTAIKWDSSIEDIEKQTRSLSCLILYIADGSMDFTSCEEDEYVPTVSLSDIWGGVWNSFEGYLDSGNYNTAVDAAITYYESVTINTGYKGQSDLITILKEWEGTHGHVAFSIEEGNIVKVYDTLQTNGSPSGTPTATIAYRYAATVNFGGIDAYAFESDRDDEFKYLGMLPVDLDEGETLVHFHFRFGSTSIEDLTDNSLWVGANSTPFPWQATVFKWDSSVEDIYGETKAQACTWLMQTDGLSPNYPCNW